MNDNVVTMPGVKLQRDTLEPLSDIVGMLESYLQRASRGEIRGIGIATVNEQGIPGTKYYCEGEQGSQNGLHTAVTMLAFSYMSDAHGAATTAIVHEDD